MYNETVGSSLNDELWHNVFVCINLPPEIIDYTIFPSPTKSKWTNARIRICLDSYAGTCSDIYVDKATWENITLNLDDVVS